MIKNNVKHAPTELAKEPNIASHTRRRLNALTVKKLDTSKEQRYARENQKVKPSSPHEECRAIPSPQRAKKVNLKHRSQKKKKNKAADARNAGAKSNLFSVSPRSAE